VTRATTRLRRAVGVFSTDYDSAETGNLVADLIEAARDVVTEAAEERPLPAGAKPVVFTWQQREALRGLLAVVLNDPTWPFERGAIRALQGASSRLIRADLPREGGA
jgi:hypothetical protein